MKRIAITAPATILAVFGLSACAGMYVEVPLSTVKADSYTGSVNAAQKDLDTLEAIKSSKNVAKITGFGMATVADQPGKSLNSRRLMAVKAAKMEAIRDLTEQVHGIQISASTTIGEAVVQNDSLSGLVNGTIRGARTVRITPKGSDLYEVVLELDQKMVQRLVMSARGLF